MKCPCHSGKLYEECCAPFHRGGTVPGPLELMRSRYAAYALGLSNYIIDTTHTKSSLYKSDRKLWKSDISCFYSNTSFENLIIIDHGDNFVTFRACLKQGEKDVSFTERSLFKKEKGHWKYFEGALLHK